MSVKVMPSVEICQRLFEIVTAPADGTKVPSTGVSTWPTFAEVLVVKLGKVEAEGPLGQLIVIDPLPEFTFDVTVAAGACGKDLPDTPPPPAGFQPS
ncbi:unannotated protein [freshwater metagenome]|uniref:Unannotated protein n=1 Tax=freshwater metagenome TaxID=449393 RepID=A0A6J6MYY5_9ZZZZ